MFNKRAIRGWRQMLANQGVVATLRTGTERLLARFHRPAQRAQQPGSITTDAPTVHNFDRMYGVETSGLIWGEELGTGSRSDRWNTAYYGISPSVFKTILSQIKDVLAGSAFIDLGSGKGRGVMLAMFYPFREIYGVELSPALSQTAERNLRLFRRHVVCDATIHLECMDAIDFEYPSHPLVLFFYHPFCKPVLQVVLKNLEQSLRANPRPAHLVYINTELRQLLDSSNFLVKVFEATLPMNAEDQLDDRVGSTQEECAIYRATIDAGKP